ncbi:hypothetical protein IQ22_02881 [Pseudomonas duriflava]|uniref:Uncharacterized protein n=1 Tax=Pseudomonas duriflava TaxID=459528 RepID=A0A562Q8H3_9PSED|nr:hypothetical protein IQ22_02881 [Pseudomonas duriflava]
MVRPFAPSAGAETTKAPRHPLPGQGQRDAFVVEWQPPLVTVDTVLAKDAPDWLGAQSRGYRDIREELKVRFSVSIRRTVGQECSKMEHDRFVVQIASDGRLDLFAADEPLIRIEIEFRGGYDLALLDR